MISVCMITYGHASYIDEAINSVLMQQTEYDFELVIVNDNSPDDTDILVNRLINEHHRGSLIKYFKHEKNIGMMPNFMFALDQCKGKYIALCEGDDYWIDAKKLQKQVRFMEENEDFSFVFTDALVKYENSLLDSYLFSKQIYGRDIFSIEDVINVEWFIPTASILFKNSLLDKPPFMKDVLNGDFLVQVILASKGKIKFFKEQTSVYRRNDGSFSAQLNLIKVYEKQKELLGMFKNYFEGKYDASLNKRISKINFNILKYRIKLFINKIIK